MTSEKVAEHEAGQSAEAVSAKAVDDQLIDELVSWAQAEGLQLTGEGGLLQQLTKRLLESALALTTSAMTSTTGRARTAVTPVTANAGDHRAPRP